MRFLATLFAEGYDGSIPSIFGLSHTAKLRRTGGRRCVARRCSYGTKPSLKYHPFLWRKNQGGSKQARENNFSRGPVHFYFLTFGATRNHHSRMLYTLHKNPRFLLFSYTGKTYRIFCNCLIGLATSESASEHNRNVM